MKTVKHLLRGLLLWWGLAGNAFAVEQYCAVILEHGGLSPHYRAIVDYGSAANGYIVDDESGKPLLFQSPVGPLNHMAAQGWRFVDTYVHTSAARGDYTGYLLVRGTPSRGPVARPGAPTANTVAIVTTRKLCETLGRTPDPMSDEWKRDTKAVETLLDEGERPSSLLRAAQTAASGAGATEPLADVLTRGLESMKTAP